MTRLNHIHLRVIEQLNVDGIAAGGGSIHCTTQQEILV